MTKAASPEIAELIEAADRLSWVMAAAPELNMGNYSDYDVSSLNNAMIECWKICQEMQAALAKVQS